MSSPRRRIVRVVPANNNNNNGARPRQAERLRRRLHSERQALARWLVRLRRAFNTFTKLQKSITRMERQLTGLEEE
jgi:hypothetical protein